MVDVNKMKKAELIEEIEQKNEELKASVTDEDIQKYIEENKKDFYSVSRTAQIEFLIHIISYHRSAA